MVSGTSERGGNIRERKGREKSICMSNEEKIYVKKVIQREKLKSW